MAQPSGTVTIQNVNYGAKNVEVRGGDFPRVGA